MRVFEAEEERDLTFEFGEQIDGVVTVGGGGGGGVGFRVGAQGTRVDVCCEVAAVGVMSEWCDSMFSRESGKCSYDKERYRLTLSR